MGVIGLLVVLRRTYLRPTYLSHFPVKKVHAEGGDLAVETPEEREAREALQAANEVGL